MRFHSMKKQLGDVILEVSSYRQLQQSEQVKPLLSPYIQDAVQKGEPKNYTRLKNMVVRYLEQQTREKHFSYRERQLEMNVVKITV